LVEQRSADITRLLRAWVAGDGAAIEELMPLVYDELHRLAERYMRREREGNSLQTTALVNEAYLRLVDLKVISWQDRAHFFAISANVMRRILVDAARARAAGKRGGRNLKLVLNESIDGAPLRSKQLIRLDDALQALSQSDERKAKVVELRFFGGLTVDETARVLGISADTARRDWKVSRAWLLRELAAETPGR
jgi:RNA polymerase sigma factor (TIGR02999 family)